MKKSVGILASFIGLTFGFYAAAQTEIELMSGVNSAEVGQPPPEWYWTKKVQEDLDIDVNISWVLGGSYGTVLTTRAGANDLPDLFFVTPQDVAQLAPQGLLGDWGPLLGDMPDYVKDHDVTALAPIGTFGGTQYGLVTQTAFPYKPFVSVRQDWLDKLGLETPQTTGEYLEVMKAFTTQDPDGNGRNDTYSWSAFVNDNGTYGGLDPLFGAFDALGAWQVRDGQLTPVATSPERRQALEFISQVVAAGVMDPDWQAQKFTDFNNKWKAGRIGLFVDDWCATYCVGNYPYFAEINPTGRLAVINPPVGPDGASAGATYARHGNIFAVSQKAIDAGKGEAIAKLFEWMATDGYYPTSYGPKGECWHRDETGKIIQNNENACIIQRQLVGWSYKGNDEELQSRYALVTEHSNGETIDTGTLLKRSYDYPKTDVTDFAAVPPASPVIAADLQRTIAATELQFMLGQKSFDEWDDYVATLNGIGLEQYTAEANQAAAESGIIQ